MKGEYINPAEMISLSSEIKCMDQLRAEVCRIPLKPNSNGKIQILSKVEMAKKALRVAIAKPGGRANTNHDDAAGQSSARRDNQF